LADLIAFESWNFRRISVIDSLKHVKKLVEAGISRKHAEANVGVMADIASDLATKEDFKRGFEDLIQTLDLRFTKIDSEFKELRHLIKESEFRVTVRLGSIIPVTLASMIALAKLLSMLGIHI
jgi:hypothetical protein